jgi:chemotaxis protein methyltransferase WspC
MTRDGLIEETVAEAAGIDIEAVGRGAFARSVNSRIARRGFSSAEDYAEALSRPGGELEELLEEIVVPETWFFRDRGPFEFVRNWALAARGDCLRVLSCPCSTGEEPYSIAITLLEAGLPPDRISIDAVDISRRALEKAERGVYGKSSFREDIGERSPYFEAVEDQFAISKEITRLVSFHRDDLMRPSYLARQKSYDIVFCRNLLIYLNATARRAVLRNIERLLSDDGVAVVGASELPIFLKNGYVREPHSCSFACRKGMAPGPAAGRRKPPVRPRITATPPLPVAVPEPATGLDEAWRLADEGAFEAASALCDGLIAGAPAEPEHHYLRGVLNEARDQLQAAEESFRKALYLDPDHYGALLHMSALCQRRGEPGQGELFRRRAERLAGRGVDWNGTRR